jgi:transcriptional/translational regulatory protein YebC/TACO1
VRTSAEDFLNVKEALVEAGYEVEGEVTMIPATETELDVQMSEKVQRLIDMLEDLDDVQAVYSNAAFTEETET